MTTNPGHPNQGAIRRNARVFGILLVALGVLVLIGSLVVFLQAFSNDYDPFEEEGIPRPVFGVVGFFAGGVLLVLGRGLLAAGYGGAALRYAAGEAAPSIKETMTYLKGDESGAAEVSGPFCSKCGVRNDADARFCDACGNPLAPAG